MAKPSKKPNPAKSLKPVKAWAFVRRWPQAPSEIEHNRLYSSLYGARKDYGGCFGASRGLAPRDWFVPVMIVPITKKTTNKKARRA